MSVARERLVVLHRFVDAAVSSVGEREFRGNAGSPDLQTDGFELDLLGGDLSRLQGGPLLWTHGEDGGDPLIGTVTRMTATAQELPFTAEFLPAGVDPLADDLCRTLKAGAPYGMSLGFTIEEYERLPGGAGMRALKWTALELSLCAVQVDAKAVVPRARAARLLRSARRSSGSTSACAACRPGALFTRGRKRSAAGAATRSARRICARSPPRARIDVSGARDLRRARPSPK